MKTKILVGLFFCFSIFGCKPGAESGNVVTSPKSETIQSAPLFTLESTDGKQVSLSDFKGKVVFLDFWATWCPPCRMSMPAIIKLNEKMKGKSFVAVGINMGDSPASVKKYVQNNRIEHLILYNGNSGVENDYNIRAIPTFYLIDPKGQMIKNYSGFYPGIENEWEKEINLLLAAKK